MHMPWTLESPLAEIPFTVVDLETTGMKPPGARVTEVAAVQIQGGEMGIHLSTLVDPGVPIPAQITQITGITQAMVTGRPTIDEVWGALRGVIGQSVLVAHNAPFDLGFLEFESMRLDRQPLASPEICTVQLSRKAWPELPSHRLDSVAGSLGLEFEARHRALGDARVTARVLMAALEILEGRGIRTAADLFALQRSARARARLQAIAPDRV